MGETTGKAADKAPKKSWFKGIRSEFKRLSGRIKRLFQNRLSLLLSLLFFWE